VAAVDDTGAAVAVAAATRPRLLALCLAAAAVRAVVFPIRPRPVVVQNG
jgi:hypothetical protein